MKTYCFIFRIVIFLIASVCIFSSSTTFTLFVSQQSTIRSSCFLSSCLAPHSTLFKLKSPEDEYQQWRVLQQYAQTLLADPSNLIAVDNTQLSGIFFAPYKGRILLLFGPSVDLKIKNKICSQLEIRDLSDSSFLFIPQDKTAILGGFIKDMLYVRQESATQYPRPGWKNICIPLSGQKISLEEILLEVDYTIEFCSVIDPHEGEKELFFCYRYMYRNNAFAIEPYATVIRYQQLQHNTYNIVLQLYPENSPPENMFFLQKENSECISAPPLKQIPAIPSFKNIQQLRNIVLDIPLKTLQKPPQATENFSLENDEGHQKNIESILSNAKMALADYKINTMVLNQMIHTYIQKPDTAYLLLFETVEPSDPSLNKQVFCVIINENTGEILCRVLCGDQPPIETLPTAIFGRNKWLGSGGFADVFVRLNGKSPIPLDVLKMAKGGCSIRKITLNPQHSIQQGVSIPDPLRDLDALYKQIETMSALMQELEAYQTAQEQHNLLLSEKEKISQELNSIATALHSLQETLKTNTAALSEAEQHTRAFTEKLTLINDIILTCLDLPTDTSDASPTPTEIHEDSSYENDLSLYCSYKKNYDDTCSQLSQLNTNYADEKTETIQTMQGMLQAAQENCTIQTAALKRELSWNPLHITKTIHRVCAISALKKHTMHLHEISVMLNQQVSYETIQKYIHHHAQKETIWTTIRHHVNTSQQKEQTVYNRIQELETQRDNALEKIKKYDTSTMPRIYQHRTYTVTQIRLLAEKKKQLEATIRRAHYAVTSYEQSAATQKKKQHECANKLQQVATYLQSIDHTALSAQIALLQQKLLPLMSRLQNIQAVLSKLQKIEEDISLSLWQTGTVSAEKYKLLVIINKIETLLYNINHTNPLKRLQEIQQELFPLKNIWHALVTTKFSNKIKEIADILAELVSLYQSQSQQSLQTVVPFNKTVWEEYSTKIKTVLAACKSHKQATHYLAGRQSEDPILPQVCYARELDPQVIADAQKEWSNLLFFTDETSGSFLQARAYIEERHIIAENGTHYYFYFTETVSGTLQVRKRIMTPEKECIEDIGLTIESKDLPYKETIKKAFLGITPKTPLPLPTHIYIQTDFVPGCNLEEFLMSKKHSLEFFSYFFMVSIEVLKAFNVLAEKKIVYRDAKPENIFADEQDQKLKITILDVGSAEKQGRRSNSDGTVIGTPLYISSDSLLFGETSTASDRQSIGAVLHDLLCKTIYNKFTAQDCINTWALEYLSHPNEVLSKTIVVKTVSRPAKKARKIREPLSTCPQIEPLFRQPENKKRFTTFLAHILERMVAPTKAKHAEYVKIGRITDDEPFRYDTIHEVLADIKALLVEAITSIIAEQATVTCPDKKYTDQMHCALSLLHPLNLLFGEEQQAQLRILRLQLVHAFIKVPLDHPPASIPPLLIKLFREDFRYLEQTDQGYDVREAMRPLRAQINNTFPNDDETINASA